MAPTTWKFVDQPIASPGVLLDMNDGATWKCLGGDFFDLPSPPLKRSIASSAMIDGGVLASAAYDLRTIKFTLELTATTEAGRESQVDALKRELAKPTNLLMFQSELSAFPVFFRTLRSDEYDLDTQFIPGKAWRIDCTILADPFAIGIRHDITTGLSLTNDLASSGTILDITGVRGDAPSPAFVRVVLPGGAGASLILGTRTMNNPTSLTVAVQAEAGTVSTDTTVQANDAAMSGAGSNYVRTTFATNANLVGRLTVTLPTATDATALRGRYRLFARVRASAAGSTYAIRYLLNPAGPDSVLGPTVTWTGVTAPQILDLGVMDFPPPGPSPGVIGYSALPPGFAARATVIQASRTAGTASLDVDYVYAMPADERLCSVQQGAAVPFLVLDGPNDMTYGMASGTTPFGATRTVDNLGGLVSRYGGLPMLVPGVTNRWYALLASGAVSASSTWDVSYWPRWREVATS